ncbi:hypothetical protein QAD02_001182 [Eretmocerus hayati]|uniref:Uncharacterized protein n=1 Tax=Eretmocerus hayati TaxID=131215 RepID=A0ACC2NFI4_9HYME|nr:hypothetical protein QAD02_001182 [Eretmocerus hayati]
MFSSKDVSEPGITHLIIREMRLSRSISSEPVVMILLPFSSCDNVQDLNIVKFKINARIVQEKTCYFVLSCHLLGTFFSQVTATAPAVKTPLGTYLGYYKVSLNGRKYAAFEGIPYAQPPIGPLRFENPVPITTRLGRFNATKKGQICAVYEEYAPLKNDQPPPEDSIKGSEDCLFLNVYMPLLDDPRKLMPVIVYLHGGWYQYNGGFLHDKYLADRDVIYLTLNYRLGLLGFLSTEDEVVPGNMGLRDQNLALRWISQFIRYFRGDPAKVTLLGFSAGSASAQYHQLSPLSRGLFSRSIALSGTVFNLWAFAAGSKQKAKQLATLFRCPINSSRSMIICLKKVPTRQLIGASKRFHTWQTNPEAPWGPVIDKYSRRPFIPRSPKEIFESRSYYDVPAIYGVAQDEGCDPISAFVPHANLLQELDKNWVSIAPALLGYNYTIPNSMYDKVAVDSRKEYLGNSTIDINSVAQLQQLLTDQRFFIGIETGVRLQAVASLNPVYMYYYSYRATTSMSDDLSGTRNNYGVCHGDDVNLVFDSTISAESQKTVKDHQMTNFMLDMWTSMAYFGAPRLGVNWRPVDASDSELKYLHIAGPGNVSMSGSTDFGRKSFWKKFFFTV